jgi:serine/threonine-protein kinase OSR1/STK39
VSNSPSLLFSSAVFQRNDSNVSSEGPIKATECREASETFFFQARPFVDYIARHVLEGLPPLGERVKNLKITDANRLAQKKMPFDEQEEKSQNEYKRGVSSWNFNLEDLKKQAALVFFLSFFSLLLT